MRDQWTVKLPRQFVVGRIKSQMIQPAKDYRYHEKKWLQAEDGSPDSFASHSLSSQSGEALRELQQLYITAKNTPSTLQDQEYISLSQDDLEFLKITPWEAEERAL